MFINRFYDWCLDKLDVDDEFVPGFIFAVIFLWFGVIALLMYKTAGIEILIWMSIVILLFSEWAYFSKLKGEREKLDTIDLVVYKLGYIFGTFPIVAYPAVAIYNYRHILNWFQRPEIIKEVTIFLIILGVIAVIILFFVINVKLGKGVIADSLKNKKGGKKK